MGINVKQLKRDPQKVHSVLKELADDRLICVKPVKIYIPARFAERELAAIGVETYIVGIFAMVVGETYYAVSLVNAMIRIEPSSTLRVMVEDEEYFEFGFDAGATVFSSTQLVKNDTLVYKIYNEINAKGRVPWYLGYLELGKLYDTAKSHAGANIGMNHEVTELTTSMVARREKDRAHYWREGVSSLEDLEKDPPVFIPLRSVEYAATNTTNKLAGSYFERSLTSALVSPADRVENIESILRR